MTSIISFTSNLSRTVVYSITFKKTNVCAHVPYLQLATLYIKYLQSCESTEFIDFRHSNRYKISLILFWRLRNMKKKFSNFQKKNFKNYKSGFFSKCSTSYSVTWYIKSCVIIWRFTWQCPLSWYRGEKQSYNTFKVEILILPWKSGSHQSLTLRDRFIFQFYGQNAKNFFFDSVTLSENSQLTRLSALKDCGIMSTLNLEFVLNGRSPPTRRWRQVNTMTITWMNQISFRI